MFVSVSKLELREQLSFARSPARPGNGTTGGERLSLAFLSRVPWLGGPFPPTHVVQIEQEHGISGQAYRVFQLRLCNTWLPLTGNEPTAHGVPDSRQRPPSPPLAHLVSTASSTLGPCVHLWALTHHNLPTCHTSSTEPTWVAPGLSPAGPKGFLSSPRRSPCLLSCDTRRPLPTLPSQKQEALNHPCAHMNSPVAACSKCRSGALAPRVLTPQKWRAVFSVRAHVEKEVVWCSPKAGLGLLLCRG